MKKLINKPDAVVDEMIDGFLAFYPGLSRLAAFPVLLRSDALAASQERVALLSGGGSGHEPAHAGYIGQGMLTAAIAGQVFTSPGSKSILAAIKAVTGKQGAVQIVKNYTGDSLNFGYAAELARQAGLDVRTVTVADDVALAAAQDRSEARGLAGAVLVHKIAGAAAEAGRSLPDVVAIAQAAADAIGTMGVALAAGTSPVTAKQSFVLSEGEIELGLGIHGEPGTERIAMEEADAIVERLIEPIVKARKLLSGDRLAVLLNNLGATTPMELAIAGRKVFSALQSRRFVVERIYAGTFLSSLDMAGISLSLLPVDDERLRWLDAPTVAPAWPNSPLRRPAPLTARTLNAPASAPASSDAEKDAENAAAHPRAKGRANRDTPHPTPTIRAALAACRAIIAAEERLTDLDRAVGDGDLGNNLARGAKAVETVIPRLNPDDPAALLKSIGVTLEDVIGGSSGPLYGVLFVTAAAALQNHDERNDLRNLATWAQALRTGCAAVTRIGGAQPGDRTMLDALLPFAAALESAPAGSPLAENAENPLHVLTRAADAAERGAGETARMLPRRGRSRYLAARALGHQDPGAVAASIWLNAVVLSLRS